VNDQSSSAVRICIGTNQQKAKSYYKTTEDIDESGGGHFEHLKRLQTPDRLLNVSSE